MPLKSFVFLILSCLMFKILCRALLLGWFCALRVHGSGLNSLNVELMNTCKKEIRIDAENSLLEPSSFFKSLSGKCALKNSIHGLQNASEDSVVEEGVSLLGTSASAGTGISIVSSSLSMQEDGSGTKRVHEKAKKKDKKQNAAKRQKINTITMASTALMSEAEARMSIEEFDRCFEEGTKVWSRMPSDITEFAEDLAQRGLTSAHSREIVEHCTASEKWLGHTVFWRMMIWFLKTQSLELALLNRLEGKKTVVLRDRKTSGKPLSECTIQHITRTISIFYGTESMEIQCNLNFLEDKGTVNVPSVLKWLLHHVNIRCVGITCDLTEVNMNSAVLGRQMEALAKEWRGSRVRIDTLTLRFILAQYKDAAVVVKECPWVTVLKIHFVDSGQYQNDGRNQALKALLLHCPALEQLSAFGIHVGIGHIRVIVAMLPQLVLLEVESFFYDRTTWALNEEPGSVFPGLRILKISTITSCNYGIENLACLFPNLQSIRISVKHVTPPLIDALSKLRLLRSLETVNGLLTIETVKDLLERLPNLEYLCVGVKELNNALAQALSKCTSMHMLKLRGQYTADFLSSLLQPSPLMSTLQVLDIYKYSTKEGEIKFTKEDIISKTTAAKKFGCLVQIIY